MNPSDLAWWAWMLVALVAVGGTALAISFSDECDEVGERFWKVIAFCAGIFALGTGLIGFVRFIKWVWD